MQQHQTNSQNNLTFLKSNYKYKRRNMLAMRALPFAARKPNQLAATLSKTSATAAATAATATATPAAAAAATGAATTVRKCSTILSLFIVIIWKALQAMANCLLYAARIIANDNDDDDVVAADDDDDDEGNAYVSAGHDHDVNTQIQTHLRNTQAGNKHDNIDANDEVSTARERQQRQQQQQQQQQQQPHLSSSSPQKSSRCTTTAAATTTAYTTTTSTTTTTMRAMLPAAAVSGLPLMTLLIALLLSMRLASAGTCWQTHLDSGKCNQIFSTNITKSDCCGASQTFSYTDRELSSVEHFFATAIGNGVECAPCLETCKGFKCGPNKKCVKRKGRPKCVCAPDCGATLRRKQQQQQQQQQQHRNAPEQQQQWASSLLLLSPRGSRSLSSEITNSNLGLDGAKRQHKHSDNNNSNRADNQRKQQQQQQQSQEKSMPKRASHRTGMRQGETRHRRLLIIDSSNLQEQPTTRRLHMEDSSSSSSSGSSGKVQMQMKVEMERMTPPWGSERRRHRKNNSSSSNNNGKHLTRSMTTATATATGANDSSTTPAQTTAQSRHKLANANEPANDINRQSRQDNAPARGRHQHQQQQQQQQHAPNHEQQQYDNGTQQRRRKHKHNHKDQRRTNTTMSGSGSGLGSGSGGRRRLYLAEHGSETAASSGNSHGHLANVDDLAFLAGIYEAAPVLQQQHTNPVCGNDGRTYNTECQLRKRACRTNNAQLEVAYRGHCKTSCNGVQCLNGLTCVEDQYMMPHCITCKIECPWDDMAYDLNDDGQPDEAATIAEERAVCGIDGNTYRSTCDINRMICKIGRSIAVAYPGPCRADRLTCADIKCGPKDTCLVDLQTHMPRCVSCRYKCARKQQRTQYRADKICGYNNHTYNSWCEMRKDSCATGYFIGVRATGVC
ncbi:uncharacterized protein LOC115762183 [Drosophila novamexicana]|uniref:uncharacterized protein LOC115762183 n=1 Tax=Drosophila novamexicana TaxID=47314 RepID=UPI0011E5F124|nr:uncharacterized protein LOC115762183 [Drosophila novamexicana]